MFLVTFLLPFPPFVKFFQKAKGKRMLFFFFIPSTERQKKKRETADRRSEFDLLVLHGVRLMSRGHPRLFSLETRKSRD